MTDKAKPPSGRNVDGTFAKGHRANPKGAPKKQGWSRIPSAIDVLNHPFFAKENTGFPSGLRPREQQQFRVFVSALEGKKRAVRTVLKWIVERDAARVATIEAARRQRKRPAYIQYESENLDKAVRLLGLTVPMPQVRPHLKDPVLLHPWIVNAALSRRHGGARLTQHEVDNIKRVTSSRDAIRWPRGYHKMATKDR